MISPKHKTIFVHIPKVAGQSIETLFLDDLGLTWENREELLLRRKKSTEKGPRRLAHLKAKDYVELGYIEATTFSEFFTFSFVRNPYARALSLYNYLGYSKIISFSDFVEKVLSKKLNEGHFFFQSQYVYLYSEAGELLVDFVGKLENIEDDIEHVLEKAGLLGKKLPHVNKSEKGLKRGLTSIATTPSLLKDLKVKNMLSRQKIKQLSSAQKEKVYNLYSKDFECFNYEK